MKNFTSVNDVTNIGDLLAEAKKIKTDPVGQNLPGKNKTIGLIFLNPSLRTRMSTQKAAMNLGMNVMVINANNDSWTWEFEDGAVMDGKKTEHIKDAAAVIGQYCDMVAIRCFPSLTNREEDYTEKILKQFIKYCNVPVISLESATLHPLQSFADLLTIFENHKQKTKPKVLLTWAPHVRALPQAVANSFSEWMCRADAEFSIAHPRGYELKEDFTRDAKIFYNQDEALVNADFVYVKSWSAYHEYGLMPPFEKNEWALTAEKMRLTNDAKIMHCLPVRRNVELADELLDSENSLVQQQAGNRVIAAQVVIKKILERISTQKFTHHERSAVHF